MEMLAAIIFVLMYVLIVSEKVHRTIVAMMGAILMIIEIGRASCRERV